MPICNGFFSSESFPKGYPGKLADHVSNVMLDEFLRLEPTARFACETLLVDQYVIVSGEFKTRRPETFPAVRVLKACFSAHVSARGAL